MNLQTEKIKRVVELVNESEISSIKNVVSGLLKIVNDPKSNAKDLKGIIEVDPPLTARILKLSNSAFYAPRKKINEILQAIIWVGYDAVRELALSQKVCAIFKKNEVIENYSRNSLWRHSVAVALLGKLIYRREFGEKGDNIYAAGLLHDIGLVVEDQFYHDEFKLALKTSRQEKVKLTTVEYNGFGFEHCQVGKALTESWKLPNDISVAIGDHHNPEGVSQELLTMVTTLHVSDFYCRENGFGYWEVPYADTLTFDQSMAKLKLSNHAISLIVEDVKQEISKMEDEGFFE